MNIWDNLPPGVTEEDIDPEYREHMKRKRTIMSGNEYIETEEEPVYQCCNCASYIYPGDKYIYAWDEVICENCLSTITLDEYINMGSDCDISVYTAQQGESSPINNYFRRKQWQ